METQSTDEEMYKGAPAKNMLTTYNRKHPAGVCNKAINISYKIVIIIVK